MALSALLTTLTPVLGNVLDRVLPDQAARDEVQAQLQIALADREAELQTAILELAREDAKSGKGGFRWGAGWLCIFALGWTWILQPIATYALAIFSPDVPPPPALPSELAYSMLIGMLGLAGVRSYDLASGTRD